MKRYISFLFFFFLSCHTLLSQPNKKASTTKYDPFNLTKEQKVADSIQFEKFKKENPESFLNKRLPVKLNDGYAVQGYSTGIQITNNYIADSVYHNFHPGMSDTSTLIPFNDIKVTDPKININLFSHLMLMGRKYDAVSITPVEIEGKWMFQGKSIPIGNFIFKEVAIKISINGRLLFDWKPLENFSKQIYKLSAKFNDFGSGEMNAYNYGYSICDTTLNVNDQLLIEIKNTKNNWMTDRYNITRVGIKPFLAEFTHDSSSNKNITEFIAYQFSKKDNMFKRLNEFYFGWDTPGLIMTNDSYFSSSRFAFYFRKPSPDFPDSSLEYKLIGNSSSDSNWHKSGHLIIVDRQPPNGYYDLSVRYINSPENIRSYKWYVKPKWYQTVSFKIIIGVITLLFLILVIIAIYKTRLREEKQRRSKLNMELRSIQSQLNPHFIFNSLGSIQGLINTNKINAANEYLSEFSNLMRNTLTDSDKIFQTLNKEIKILDTYLKLEQLRFEFKYTIKADDSIPKNETKIPTLLLQPLVENAVKHGVSGLRKEGKVEIIFAKENSNLIAAIKDNGNGFPVEKEKSGYGWKLTDDKIKLLNKMLKGRSIERKIFRENDETIAQVIFKNWL